VVAGAANTLLTSAVYFICLLACPPTIAYGIAWLLGIAFVMIVYPDRVFVGSEATIHRRMLLGLTVAAVFFAGEAVLSAFISMTGRSDLAFFATLAFTFMLNFVLARVLIRRIRL
jgi:putative flippase GtrA